MTQLFKSGTDQPGQVSDDILVNRAQIESASLNDPTLHSGVMYFDQAPYGTHYLYQSGDHIFWKPGSGDGVQLDS